jgi:hypothetical protein
MIAIPAKADEITKATVEEHPNPCMPYVYLTVETDATETVYLCLIGLDSIDDVINKLIAVRNRVWPFPRYEVPA